jgi:type IV pilus assembly protein PilB
VHRSNLTEDQRAQTAAHQHGLRFVEVRSLTVDATAVATVSEATIDRCQALPVGFEGRHLVVATADPHNLQALDDIALMSGHPVLALVVSGTGLRWLIERHRRSTPDVAGLQAVLEGNDRSDLSIAHGGGAAGEAQDPSIDEHAVVQVVERILRDGIASGASDIHLEPGREQLQVRLRIDGLLRTRLELPALSADAINARVKLLARLDVSEKRRPQDGRFTTRIGGQRVDLRVASLPTIAGEKVVLRVLPRAEGVPDLGDLAFHPTNLAHMLALATQPHGLFLITGPTGSGKTLTTFALLRRLAIPERHVVTVEDPVEIELPGVVQTQVQPKAGYDFPTALRALLRHDPDVIVVGEVRDRETASLAVEAAATGHAVIASLHTQDALGALVRLRDLGIEPFKLAASLRGVLAQRLLRRVCGACAVGEPLGSSERAWFANEGIPPTEVNLRRGAGCKACDMTGTAGRMAVHELLMATPSLLELVAREVPRTELLAVAQGAGMRSLRRDAAEKGAAGSVPFAEVIAVGDAAPPRVGAHPR